jgi:RNA polymerase sigma-70 factor (ECF subfamily)
MKFRIHRLTQDQLIKGCIQKDPKAQKRLYDSYASLMYPVCCRYLKNHEEAEDVLVIAFTKIFDKISQFNGLGSFEGWIKRIVINEALNHLRSRSKVEISDIDESSPIGCKDADRLEEEDLIDLISSLPNGYRQVFNMYAIDGYSHKEIADALSISEGTSKSQLNRARAFLQRRLNIEEQQLKTKSR